MCKIASSPRSRRKPLRKFTTRDLAEKVWPHEEITRSHMESVYRALSTLHGVRMTSWRKGQSGKSGWTLRLRIEP